MPEKKQLKIDVIGITKAREEFKKRNFKESLKFYDTVILRTSFQNLDLQIIEFCVRKIGNVPINY